MKQGFIIEENQQFFESTVSFNIQNKPLKKSNFDPSAQQIFPFLWVPKAPKFVETLFLHHLPSCIFRSMAFGDFYQKHTLVCACQGESISDSSSIPIILRLFHKLFWFLDKGSQCQEGSSKRDQSPKRFPFPMCKLSTPTPYYAKPVLRYTQQ